MSEQNEGLVRGPATGSSGNASAATPLDTKVCPDCAETVKAAARLCRFCDHDFRKAQWGQSAGARTVGVRTTSSSAVVSLIFGILWIWGVGSFVALVCGYVAKRHIAADPERRSGHGLAIAGIVLGWLGVGLALLLLVIFGVPLFAKARHDAGERTAQSALRNTITAAKTIYVDSQDFGQATPERLASVEPSIKFTGGDSVGPSAVSTYSDYEKFVAAARSGDTCFFIKIDEKDTYYAEAFTSSCSATASDFANWSTSWDQPSY